MATSTPTFSPATRFEFATVPRLIYGSGTLHDIGQLAAPFGERAFVVIGGSAERAAPLLERLQAANIAASTFSVQGEPTVEVAREGAEAARAAGAQMVISFGGGSVIDTGKAIAALLTNGGDPLDYVEIIGKGTPLKQAAAPHIAIPTTAGTGAEVTMNAVLSTPAEQLKVSMRSPLMLPRIALIDPRLTDNLPPKVTAFTGMDALTQNIEPFVSNKANPITDGFAREGIVRAGRSLQIAYNASTDPSSEQSIAARDDMALASVLGGMALANAKLGAVHGFASPIGGMFDAPHGAICAALLPHVMHANIVALRRRTPGSPVLRKYNEIARLLTGDTNVDADDGVAFVTDLTRALHIPELAIYGMTEADLPPIAEKAQKASSMAGNPIPLTLEELIGILEAALQPPGWRNIPQP